MPTIDEMAAKGSAKLTRKATSMKTSYDAAKARAKTHFGAVGFGPTRVANYNAGIDAAAYRAPSPSKWSDNWKAKMRE